MKTTVHMGSDSDVIDAESRKTWGILPAPVVES